MKLLVSCLLLLVIVSCGEVEKKQEALTKAGGDEIPGTGLPLVDDATQLRIKSFVKTINDYSNILGSSDVLKIQLPEATTFDKAALSVDAQKMEANLSSSIAGDQCLADMSPGVDSPGFNPVLPSYELRVTHSSGLKDCPLYYYKSVFTEEQPTQNQFVKNRAVQIKISKDSPSYEDVDITSYEMTGRSVLLEKPLDSNKKYSSELSIFDKGTFQSQSNDMAVSFFVENTKTVNRNSSVTPHFYSSKSSRTVQFILSLEEKKETVIGYTETTLTDVGGDVDVDSKYYMNGQEISKEQFAEIFVFGSENKF